MFKRMIALMLVLLLAVSIQAPVYADTQSELDRLRARREQLLIEQQQAQLAFDNAATASGFKDGMYGFYEWEARRYPQYADDCQRALDALNNCPYVHFNKRGDYNDATALDNVLPMEAFLNECNRLRQQDDNFDRHDEVFPVNNLAMAMSQANANYAANQYYNSWIQYHNYSVTPHSNQFLNKYPYWENVTCAINLYDDWYHREKLDYEGKPGGIGQTGHYENLMRKTCSVMPTGLACNTMNSFWTCVQNTLYSSSYFMYYSETPTQEFYALITSNGLTYTDEQIDTTYQIKRNNYLNYNPYFSPKISISEYFSMVKEYYNLVCPKAEKTALEKANKAVEEIDKQIAGKERELQSTPAPTPTSGYRFISIDASNMLVKAGKTTKVTVTTSPAKNASFFKWKSSNTKWATVDSNGVVTTKKAGAGHTVKITAMDKDEDGGSYSINIVIMKAKAKKIKLTAAKKVLKSGEKIKIKANTEKAITWKSYAGKYGVVSKKGVLKVYKNTRKGYVITITATAKDGSGDCGLINFSVE